LITVIALFIVLLGNIIAQKFKPFNKVVVCGEKDVMIIDLN